jgi:hypothetical protein
MQNTNAGPCGCNDYAQQTALTGIAVIDTANPYLTGQGAIATVITGATNENGTMVKSVIIKAAMPVTNGMVRLFVFDGSNYSLYKEVPIPTMPVLANTPTPVPIMQNFEISLAGGLKLPTGYSLCATTQNGESFNVIAEGVGWNYNSILPPGCCSFKQETAIIGVGNVSTANPATNGTGPLSTILTAAASPSNGTLVRTITLKALQSTNLGMIRLFISHNATTWFLVKEICIPQTMQSGFDPSFKMVLEENFNLQAGYSLGASTQLGQSFSLTVEGVSWEYPTYP